MPEPTLVPVRPIPMKSLVVVGAALLVLAGCGSADEQGSGGGAAEKKPTASPSASASASLCDHGEGEGRRIGTADLDGDGTDGAVRLLPAKQGCPAAVAVEGTSWLTGSLPPDEPPVTDAFAIAPTWHEGQLLVTRSEHPRGGYQLRIFASGPDGLTELTVDGQPVVPFVATDVPQGQARVDCSDDGFVVAAGGTATSYTVDGTTVTADGAPAKVPASQAPFAGCRP